MADIDRGGLRRQAEAAAKGHHGSHYDRVARQGCTRCSYDQTVGPPTALALVDALDAKDARIAELEGRVTSACDRLEEAGAWESAEALRQ
tara:strand:+ start:1981 stop:2250 length:270 start_codon:yes stop_codon:yes gene_type:complete